MLEKIVRPGSLNIITRVASAGKEVCSFLGREVGQPNIMGRFTSAASEACAELKFLNIKNVAVSNGGHACQWVIACLEACNAPRIYIAIVLAVWASLIAYNVFSNERGGQRPPGGAQEIPAFQAGLSRYNIGNLGI
jgi:hypothetical protein